MDTMGAAFVDLELISEPFGQKLGHFVALCGALFHVCAFMRTSVVFFSVPLPAISIGCLRQWTAIHGDGMQWKAMEGKADGNADGNGLQWMATGSNAWQ